MPLYEYDHVIGWAATQHHVADEITLLCDRHHREKTSGLLPQEAVLAANRDPFNLRTGVTPPFPLHFGSAQCSVVLGGNMFWTSYLGDGTQIVPVSIDNIPLIRFLFLDGRLLLTILIFDEFNNLVLKIWDNELQYVPEPWDIEFVGRRIIVREAKRKILVDIEFVPPSKVVISRARLLCNGVEVLVKPNEVKVPAGNTSFVFSECIKASDGGGVVIGPHPFPIGALIRIPSVPRYSIVNSDSRAWIEEAFGKAEDVEGEP